MEDLKPINNDQTAEQEKRAPLLRSLSNASSFNNSFKLGGAVILDASSQHSGEALR
jgi:hypothetical protein